MCVLPQGWSKIIALTQHNWEESKSVHMMVNGFEVDGNVLYALFALNAPIIRMVYNRNIHVKYEETHFCLG